MELLAPCGNINALLCAVAAGANAVYFGLGELNARAKAVDFNTDNLSYWVDYCHLFDVKVYVTLNVEIYDGEINRALELVSCAYNAKVDALIVSDIGLILQIRKNFPDFPIHVSTQAGVKDVNGALFFKKLGVKRVVLARECGFKEYEEISKIIEVEVFVHGALCVSFSGACLMSSYIGGNSGNRGRCKQPCRQEYTAKVNDKVLKKGYLLSPKDVNVSKQLDKLAESGVSSLKIEGRLKSPEYVYAVTSYYRGILEGRAQSDYDMLKTFNRGGFCEGYLNGFDVIYPNVANHVGVKIGKVLKIEKRNGFAFAEINCKVSKGDGLKLLRNGFEVGGSDVTSATKTSNGWLIPVSQGVKPNDEVRLTRDKEYAEYCRKQKRKLGVSFNLVFSAHEVVLKATYKGYTASVSVQSISSSRALTYQELVNQLSKLGESNFVLDSLVVVGQGYLPKSALNGLRNDVVASLEKLVIDGYIPFREDGVIPCEKEYNSKVDGMILEVPSSDLKGYVPSAVVYKPDTLYDGIFDIVDAIKKRCEKVYLRLPILLSGALTEYYIKSAVEKNYGIYADNIGLVELCRNYKVPYIAGTALNISNTISSRVLYDADAIVYTHEVGISPIEQGHTFQEGRLALMHFYHCPNRTVTDNNCSNCRSKGQTLIYESEGRSFPVKAVKADRCYYTLYADKRISIRTDNKRIFKSLCD